MIVVRFCPECPWYVGTQISANVDWQIKHNIVGPGIVTHTIIISEPIGNVRG